MESTVKHRQRLKKPSREDLTKIQTIVSSPISNTPIRDRGNNADKLSKSTHRCQTPVTKEQVNVIPKLSNRVTSAQVTKHKIARGDIDSLPVHKLCTKPKPNEPLINRDNKIQKFSSISTTFIDDLKNIVQIRPKTARRCQIPVAEVEVNSSSEPSNKTTLAQVARPPVKARKDVGSLSISRQRPEPNSKNSAITPDCKINTIRSIHRTPSSNIREISKKVLETVRRCQSPVIEEQDDSSPKSPNRATSVQVVRPKVRTTEDVGSSSISRLCPSPKESAVTRYSKINKCSPIPLTPVSEIRKSLKKPSQTAHTPLTCVTNEQVNCSPKLSNRASSALVVKSKVITRRDVSSPSTSRLCLSPKQSAVARDSKINKCSNIPRTPISNIRNNLKQPSETGLSSQTLANKQVNCSSKLSNKASSALVVSSKVVTRGHGRSSLTRLRTKPSPKESVIPKVRTREDLSSSTISRLCPSPKEPAVMRYSKFNKCSPVPRTPISKIRKSLKNPSETAHASQFSVTNEQVNCSPKPSNRETSDQVVKPKVMTRGDVGILSMDRIYLKSSLKGSVRKRNSKFDEFQKNGDWKESKGGALNQPLKVVGRRPERRYSPPKQFAWKTSTTKHAKEPQSKPEKHLKGLVKKCSCKDFKSMKEACRRIEIVFENRKRKDKVSKKGNLNILGKLYLLITFGGVEEYKPRADSVIRCITCYLCNNSCLLSQLVYILADAEDFRTCLYTIKILYQLLIKSSTIDDSARSAVKTALSCPHVLATLIESMNFIHMRFLGNDEYREELPKLHCDILQMIVAVSKTNSARRQVRRASEAAVKLIGKLISTCGKQELAECLLEAVKIICIKKKHCNVLASKKFFDGLCTCYDLTHKIFTLPMILKVMSREKSVLNRMSGNEKIVSLILEMICYSRNKSINKRALLTTLDRITTENNGLKILSKHETFYKLFHYFQKKEKCKLIPHRLGIIKAYSILNRAVNKIMLPTVHLNRNLCLPENVKKCLEEENVSDESESENDESDEDSEDDDDSDDMDASVTDKNNNNIQSLSSMGETLSDMSFFYAELLMSCDETEIKSIFKFDIYEGIVRLPNTKVIENRVHRGLTNDNHAYPDAVMLEPELDEHVLNPLINNFSIESLSYKLKCSKGIEHNTFIPRVIMDLDELHNNRRQPIIVPHPSTFIPYKKTDQNLANFVSPLKFESRFECGNLRKAIQIERYEYELLLTPDTSTTKGLQWFYFQVSNMVPGIIYTFNIANFLKCNSQHNHGMQPLMFSVLDHTLNKKGWKRVGEEIVYYGNNYTDEAGDKQYKTLSFSVSFPYPNDYVYFAYHYPYTYTRLMIKLFPFVNYKMNEIYARMDKLCNTIKTRNEIALLTITGAWNRGNSLRIPFRSRPIVFITARVHPGETNASWIMEGIIDFLLDQTNPYAVIAREHFIFKIIPMLNPEGVIYGNTRNGLTGTDLNRCWARPNKITCPEIYYAKRLIGCAKHQLKLPVAAYIDIHGHSRKKYCFFYGCNPKMSWNKKDKANESLLETLKILPEMVNKMNPSIRLAQCKYKITKNRESTGRVVMWREFDIKHSYTLECSYSFANDKQSVNTKILSDIGASVIASLGKLADQAYTSRKMVPSLALDYTCIGHYRTTDFAESRLKEGADEAATPTLFVNSRALEHTVPNKNS